MDKDEWCRLNKALQATSTRLTAELKKRVDGLQLTSLDAGGDAAELNSSLVAKVADAKLQLCQLQKQVNESQPTPTFIQDLAARISSFTELLNSLKASQRQQYGSLLQQEQALLEELGAVQVNWFEDDSSALHDRNGYDDCHQFEQEYSSSCDPGQAGADADRGLQRKQLRRSGSGFNSSAPSSNTSKLRPGTAGTSASSPQQPCGTGASASSSGSGAGSASHACGSTLLPEVVAYDNFLARHGPTGGWHPDDHNTFLAVLRQSRGDYSAALAAAVDALPGHSRQAVIAHSRWHADLTELDMRRRVALVNWRAARDAAKTARQAEAATLQDTLSLQAQPSAPDQLEKEARQVQKQMVQQWKQERLQAQQQQAQQEAEQQRQQQQRQHQQLQQRRAALKQQLEALKAAKQHAGTEVCGHQVAAAGPPAADQAQQLLAQQRVQQRNAATFNRRQQLLAAKQENQAARDKAQQQLLAGLEEAKPRVDRDPGRLLSATASAAARTASTAAEQAAADKKGDGAAAGRGSIGSGFVLHLGHKAVPAWASGMR